jgi:Zn-finger nucleic acid-binding protein
VDRCDACGGTWFDRGEVGRVLDLRTRGGRDRGTAVRLEAHFAPGMPPRDARRGRACVVCRGRMTRRLVASKGPVYVDVCASHGLWFDAGEWEAFSAFVAEGGLEVERDRADHGVRARRVRHDLSDGPDFDRPVRGLWGFFDTSR